jgi:hypothetical protein
MKRPGRTLAIWATLAIAVALAASVPASANLGGDETSVEADRARMEATLQTTNKNLYQVHEMHSPSNVVVREFVSPDGKVFGVAWQGPSRPDLSQMLGTYFDSFTKAAKQAQRGKRGPLLVQLPGLVVQMGGHDRFFSGMAYVPQMVPAGVSTGEIR